MEDRSDGLPASEPQQDDWVHGSWTVDCICGMNFDDGEEMVYCDECGVWVHTRCSRYVKGQKSFSCDKCKSKNTGVGGRIEDDVRAEFPVELPTGAPMMDNRTPTNALPRNRFRIWTNIPKEEKVHVQGVPGGEPGLFTGVVKSVFGPELWRCTGHVPRKFNSRYTEFQSLDHDEVEKRKGKSPDNGSVHRKHYIEEIEHLDAVSPKQLHDQSLDLECPKEGVKKENRRVSILLRLGKRKKGEREVSKERFVKKKAETLHK